MGNTPPRLLDDPEVKLWIARDYKRFLELVKEKERVKWRNANKRRRKKVG